VVLVSDQSRRLIVIQFLDLADQFGEPLDLHGLKLRDQAKI
jgi:hypothetical protein